MKKFKKGDTIRLRADRDESRTYEVLIGTDDSGHPPQAMRNDDKAGPWPAPFVLGSPDAYELVKRPSKKDREIERLQALVDEANTAERAAIERADVAQLKVDMQLIEAGLVRIDLLGESVIDGNWSSGPNGLRVALVIDARKDAVHQALRRMTR